MTDISWITLATTVAAGVLPFLVGDLIKVFLALVLLERFQSTSLGGT